MWVSYIHSSSLNNITFSSCCLLILLNLLTIPSDYFQHKPVIQVVQILYFGNFQNVGVSHMFPKLHFARSNFIFSMSSPDFHSIHNLFLILLLLDLSSQFQNSLGKYLLIYYFTLFIHLPINNSFFIHVFFLEI